MSLDEDLNSSRVIEFAESFHNRMHQYVTKVANNEPIDPTGYVKQLDGLLYAFTGCEDIIASDESDRSKRAKTVAAMCDHLSTTSHENILREVAGTFGFNKKDKEKFVAENKDQERIRLVANYMCHMGLMLCMQINPKWFLKKKRKKKNDTDSAEPEEGAN